VIGKFVPFLLGMPSVRAKVIGVVGKCYVLHQCYETQNQKGAWIIVDKIYYRDRHFIESYWADTIGLPLPGA